ncbi:MAG: peptidoglycan-binding protein [Oscillospiraceae bacterium]|nr:peptidoglycan-binding protein [Oscillospiraceae bacterium]
MQILRRGSVGPQVELLQLGLSRAGYLPAQGIDGIFGPATQGAVTAFQRDSGLYADGIAGPRTWSALEPWLLGYRRHMVRRGDSLYRIAQAYGSSIRAIDVANPGLDPLNLRIGRYLVVPLDFDAVPTNIRFTSTVLEFTIRGLTARYPFLKQGRMGYSVLGKPLYWLSIGEGEREVFYNGAHHANEWITTPLLMKFLENYARAYAFEDSIGGQSAAELYRRATLYIAPMVDPDGVDLVTGELPAGSAAYAKAQRIAADYPAIPFPSGWKANANGVDLNLQYPAGWEDAREIKFAQGFISPAPRDYVGTAPLDQPESRAVYNFTLAHDFKLTLSYHTQGEVIFWKYRDYEPADSYAIGRRFSQLSGYSLELTPPESANAGYKDWFIQQYDRPAYTIEAGRGTSPLPLTQFEGIYRANEGILAEGMILQ